jgi:hypothetical protein
LEEILVILEENHENCKNILEKIFLILEENYEVFLNQKSSLKFLNMIYKKGRRKKVKLEEIPPNGGTEEIGSN